MVVYLSCQCSYDMDKQSHLIVLSGLNYFSMPLTQCLVNEAPGSWFPWSVSVLECKVPNKHLSDFFSWVSRVLFQYEDYLSSYRIPITKIRQSYDCPIFMMGIPMLERLHLYIELAHRVCKQCPGGYQEFRYNFIIYNLLIHWDWVTHVCISKLDKLWLGAKPLSESVLAYCILLRFECI